MFLNPFLLFGLAGISVPIIIHLLNRRRFERVVWAAMRFVRNAVEQNQRRIRVEDLILLVLRCVLIGLIALALARPALSHLSGWAGEARVTAVVLLDNSASMSARDGNATRFEQAKKVADELLGTLPRGSSVSLMLVSDIAEPVIAEPTSDLDVVRKSIHEAALSDRSSDLLPGIKKAFATLNGRPSIRKEVYLITDRQGAGWRQTGELKELLESERRNVATNVVFVGEMPAHNLGVSGLRMLTDIAAVNRQLNFEVQVTNYGHTAVADVPVKLSVDGEPPSDSVATGEIAAGATRTVILAARVKAEGYHAVAATIPHDELPADDERSLVVRAVKQVQVVTVDGDPGREPRESKTFFLNQALQPVSPAQREGFYVQVKTVSPSELEALRLADVDAVMLANVAELPAGAVSALEKFVRDGGGLVIFPGPNANAPFYNEQLLKRRMMLPAALGDARGDAGQAAVYWTLQGKSETGYTHPIVSLWNNPDAGSLASARFFRTFDLQPAAEGPKPEALKDVAIGTPRVVIRYNDGRPAIMERSFGMGRVVLFASSAETSWNDLAVRPVYIPLVHRVLGSLLARQDELLNVQVGQGLALQEPNELLGKDVLITRPGEAGKLGPDSTRVELVHNVPTLQYDRTDNAGVYLAAVGKSPADAVMFCAGRDPGESRVEPVSAEQLRAIGSAAGVVEWKPGVPVSEALRRVRTGMELWLPLAIAALAIGTVETILAHWFSRSK